MPPYLYILSPIQFYFEIKLLVQKLSLCSVAKGWKYKVVDLVWGGCVTTKVPHLAEEMFLVHIFHTGVTVGKAWKTGHSKNFLFICYLRNVLASVKFSQ